MVDNYMLLLQALPKEIIERYEYDGYNGYIWLKNGEVITSYPSSISYRNFSYTNVSGLLHALARE